MNEKKKIRLLLVDDEDDFRSSARRALENRGFAVSTAQSGEECLRFLESQRPDVLVLDLKMEGMDGLATLEKIRDRDPELPTMILTGHGGFSDAMAGIKLSIVDFVQKPVDMDQLARRIRNHILKGSGRPLRERSIDELMVPVTSYRTIYLDQSLLDVVEALHESLFSEVLGRSREKGHRSVLVFDRDENFIDVVQLHDVLTSMIPAFLRNTPYASPFTGMFLAQTKVAGQLCVQDLTSNHGREKPRIEIDAPLMEAVHLMVSDHVVNLPVMKEGTLLGVLRDKDLLIEIARSLQGDVAG